jgi:hypothetical protein
VGRALLGSTHWFLLFFIQTEEKDYVIMIDSFATVTASLVSVLGITALAFYTNWMWHKTQKEYNLLSEQWNDLVDNYNEMVADRDFWFNSYHNATKPDAKANKAIEQDPWL